MKTRITLVILLMALTGCQSSNFLTKLNPLNWFSGRAAKTEAKVEAKQSTLEDSTVKAAQKEVVKTGVALVQAKVEHPDSLAVDVAKRTNENAAALLNQREPLSAAEQQEAVSIATGLLKKTADAEAKQMETERGNIKLSGELDGVRKELAVAHKKAEVEAAENLGLAQELHDEQFIKYGSIALNGVLAIAALMYRFNLGGLQTGVGNALGVLQKKYGTSDEDVQAMKYEIDTLTGKATQASIFTTAAKVIST